MPDTDAAQFAWLAMTGASSEDPYIEAVRELLAERPRGAIIDAGANFGVWTVALADLATEVWAFEPQASVMEVLLQTTAAMKHAHLCRVALGAEDGEVEMAALDLARPANFGGLALEEINQDQPDALMERVVVLALDDVVSPNVPVSFIKVDVEGSEADVIAGARETILRHRPILFVEVEHYRTDKAALIRVIDELGYIIERAGPNVLCIPKMMEQA